MHLVPFYETCAKFPRFQIHRLDVLRFRRIAQEVYNLLYCYFALLYWNDSHTPCFDWHKCLGNLDTDYCNIFCIQIYLRNREVTRLRRFKSIVLLSMELRSCSLLLLHGLSCFNCYPSRVLWRNSNGAWPCFRRFIFIEWWQPLLMDHELETMERAREWAKSSWRTES